jgi:hypothetical protein
VIEERTKMKFALVMEQNGENWDFKDRNLS